MTLKPEDRKAILDKLREAREQLQVARSLVIDGAGLPGPMADASHAAEKAQHAAFDAKALIREQLGV